MKSLHWKKNEPKAMESRQQHQNYAESINLQDLIRRLELKSKRIRDLEEREEVLRSTIRNLEDLLSRSKFKPIRFDHEEFPDSNTSSN